MESKTQLTICSALLVVPFILFSSLAGQVADKFEKGRLVTITKVAEIAIMLMAFYGFQTQNVLLLMILLLSGPAGGATTPTEAAPCDRSTGAPDSPQPLPMRDDPAQP